MNRRASDDTGATSGTSGRRGKSGEGSMPAMEKEKEMARDAAHEAAEAGKQRLEAGAGQAAESVDHLSDAVGAAASRLSEMEHEGLADYATRLASWLSETAEKLRSKNVEELGDDIRRTAERNPALFVLGAVAVGIGLARFAKASRQEDERYGDGAAGEPGWATGERGEQQSWSEREYAQGRSDTEWSEEVASREFEPTEPSMETYEGRDRGTSERDTERPSTPDSSGGTGL